MTPFSEFSNIKQIRSMLMDMSKIFVVDIVNLVPVRKGEAVVEKENKMCEAK